MRMCIGGRGGERQAEYGETIYAGNMHSTKVSSEQSERPERGRWATVISGVK